MASDKSAIFSIIIPMYNRAWCIERAIASVLRQGFQDWELIVVDDGSTDGTKGIVAKYLSDPRVKYFYKENGGVGSARNVGLMHANARYVMFLDSDDEFLPNALAVIFSAVSKYRDEKLYSFRAVDEKGDQISYASEVSDDLKIDFPQFISRKYIRGEAFLVFERGVFNGNSFDEDVNGGEGLLLFKLIKEHGLMVVNADVRIYHTESPDSLISSKLTIEKMRNARDIQLRLIEKYGDDLKRYNKKYLGTAYLVLARALALSGQKIESWKYFVFGCRYNAIDISRVVLYMVSLFDNDMKINNALNSFRNRFRL